MNDEGDWVQARYIRLLRQNKSGSQPCTDLYVDRMFTCLSGSFQSLSGHTSPVEAVRFGNAEEIVVAGSLSGALKIWDLEQAKSKFFGVNSYLTH